MTPFFLFFGLMVATGFIAHWSDNLGKKLGKKRVSLYGLRPKQTATLITVASSLLIMTVTFAAMLIVYKPLREALLSFDAERAANRRLENQNQNLRADFTKLEARQKELQERSRKLNADLQSTSSDLSSTQRNLQSARAAENRARNAEKTSRSREARARAGEADAQRGREQARRGEVAARRNESAARKRERLARNLEQFARKREQGARQNEARARRGELLALRNQASAQRRLASAQQQLNLAESALKLAQTNLQTAQRAERIAQNNLKEAQSKYVEQGAELLRGERELAISRAQLAQQKQELSNLQEDIARRQKQVATLQTEYKNAQELLKRAARVLTGPTLVSSRETLASKTIPARLDAATIENLLRDLLLSARSSVKKLGEANGRLGLDLTIVPRDVEIDSRVFEADETAQLNVLAQSLGGANASSVRVVAARNHGVDEPDIKAAFEVVPIRIAYRRDEVIATAVIDGRRSDGQRNAAKIFNQLLALVNEGQRLAEQERRVEPPLGRDTQFYAPDTNERIFDAINDIQALGAVASVRLRAAEDLTTAAPLRVHFEVLPATANA